MDSRIWREVGQSALAGALAGVALMALGLRVRPGAVVDLDAAGPQEVDPYPLAALPAPLTRSDQLGAVARQAATGAALGAVYGYLRTRAGGGYNPIEREIYGGLLAALGLERWGAPLGLDVLASPDSRGEVIDETAPPYESQPPYDDAAPYDVF